MTSNPLSNYERFASFLGGATAGICVDLTVYPMDTIKTRLQSGTHAVKPQAGGNLGLFAGLPAVILGSAPAAALFFVTYETIKRASMNTGAPLWMASMLSACAGDVVAYIVRVPVETIKQRTQNQPHLNVRIVFRDCIREEGWRGLYRGYWGQLSRGLPFCIIQYPIWESLKLGMQQYNRRHRFQKDYFVSVNCCIKEECGLSKTQFAICGAVAGAIGGFLTTPMDVAKTRIILAKVKSDLIITLT
ncbi:unnamed protein product [Hymenolepis diminuta]|uniref:S-adenosylmethionine mitochondrial carrier protein n=1 Tax=Hymenolepis diminuta TaxID=6216 RepID=A0A0R3SKH8_HYMDI|nr:unnamed protein product [Hymenolepis diminuta]